MSCYLKLWIDSGSIGLFFYLLFEGTLLKLPYGSFYLLFQFVFMLYIITHWMGILFETCRSRKYSLTLQLLTFSEFKGGCLVDLRVGILQRKSSENLVHVMFVECIYVCINVPVGGPESG